LYISFFGVICFVRFGQPAPFFKKHVLIFVYTHIFPKFEMIFVHQGQKILVWASLKVWPFQD